ncbi:hypothetical protein Prum_095050 [Phytohabitans rumicis]|uniref:Uncharacterized protein n=1 Tax=Phytohabitans rumicis TaxID=1076125 RepID=A0A6V8LF61_9ACTN|nr:hypothetical protein Prum_095050 [Phytohabitans rumicis]
MGRAEGRQAAGPGQSPASGCPVYTKRSTGEAIAKGIISGGSAITSGDCWLNFTDTYLAEKALPGIIKHT